MARILLIETQYFSYNEIIKESLESKGYEVDWMDDRPSNTIWDKCILRVKPSLMKNKINKYFYNKIVSMARERQYDIVLVILGQSFNSGMFIDLKKVIPHSKFVLYLWDSVENFPAFEDLANGFDITYSFDPKDCEKYGFEFLPLFYNEKNLISNAPQLRYDVSFIGTVKKGKLPYLNNLKNQLVSHFKNVYFYLYLQSKLVYFFNKIFNDDFKGSHINDFEYDKIPYSKNVQIAQASKIIVDATMSKQNGLSMRTIETLAYGKKLITNNQEIMNYDFYRPENIYVYDGKEIDFENVFFTKEYQPLSKDLLEKYSIENWLKTLLIDEEEKYERHNPGGWLGDAAVSIDESDE